MFTLLFWLTFVTAVLCQGPPPYYGLPLGAVFYSADGTQGEVYASDPNTLTIVNFYHKGQPGCKHLLIRAFTVHELDDSRYYFRCWAAQTW